MLRGAALTPEQNAAEATKASTQFPSDRGGLRTQFAVLIGDERRRQPIAWGSKNSGVKNINAWLEVVCKNFNAAFFGEPRRGPDTEQARNTYPKLGRTNALNQRRIRQRASANRRLIRSRRRRIGTSRRSTARGCAKSPFPHDPRKYLAW
jgi:hypothetical protein